MIARQIGWWDVYPGLPKQCIEIRAVLITRGPLQGDCDAAHNGCEPQEIQFVLQWALHRFAIKQIGKSLKPVSFFKKFLYPLHRAMIYNRRLAGAT